MTSEAQALLGIELLENARKLALYQAAFEAAAALFPNGTLFPAANTLS